MPRPYFHKLILSKTIRDKKLRIPDNFVKRFGNDFPACVRLTVPGGHLWRIGVKKADGKIWFHDHWQEFIERYSICVGYFLVFRYEGNAVFNVLIFDLSASEINYQTNALSGKRSLVFEDMEDDEIVENFSDFIDQMAMKKSYSTPAVQNLFHESKLNCVNWPVEGNSHLSKGANMSQLSTQSTRNTDSQLNEVGLRSPADGVRLYNFDGEEPKPKKRGRKKLKIDPTDEQQSATQHIDESDARYRFYESASARKRTITAEERERAINAAKVFEPVNPFCRVVLRPSYLYRGCIMYLPSCFAEKHLNGVSGFIRIQFTDGKQWPVRCLYRGGRAKLSQGWYEFCMENNLGEGDVCVFELLKSRDIVLKVTAFRVLENPGNMNQPRQHSRDDV